jgi:RTX calcium-binding nonapeptide repeat (4 copies)
MGSHRQLAEFWNAVPPSPPSPPEGATITGTPGPDLLIGTEGPDRILGLEGSDTIRSAGGNDTVFGDAENGPTPPLGGPPVPTTLPGNLILAGAGDDSVTAGWGPDTVFGGSGGDTLIGYGGGFPSPAGFDAFLRRAGADLLSGEAGNDRLVGGGGNDALLGGAGDDVLPGRYGADLLEGGEGADRFAYSPADPFRTSSETGLGEGNRDIILDFVQGKDVLDFTGYRFSLEPLPSLFLGTGEFQAFNRRAGALRHRRRPYHCAILCAELQPAPTLTAAPDVADRRDRAGRRLSPDRERLPVPTARFRSVTGPLGATRGLARGHAARRKVMTHRGGHGGRGRPWGEPPRAAFA